jgi:hypothetical protein
MHDNSSGGDDVPPTDPPPERQAQDVATEGLSASDYLHLAEECLLLASLTKDPEKVAELLRTSDDYLRRASKWIADQLKNH